MLSKWVFLSCKYLRQWSSEAVVPTSIPQLHIAFRQSSKLCLNLWSRRWLKPSRNLMINFTHLGLSKLKKEFALGRMNFRILLLKTLMLSELRISGPRMFHSFIVAGKKEFFKYSWLVLHWGILFEFLIAYLVSCLVISLKK